MTTVTEPILAIQWVRGLLDPDAPLLAITPGGIHTETVPPSAGYPRVIVQSQGGGLDLRSDNEAELVWSEPLIVVKAIDKAATYKRVGPIAARIYDLVNGTEGTLPGGRIVSCVRELVFSQPENEGATEWRTIIQQFRVQAYAGE